MKATDAIKITIDNRTCHIGGSKGNLAGISMGENSGNIDPNTATEPLGLFMTGATIDSAMITGMKIGIISCWPSPKSSPIAEPTAANREE